MNQIAVARVALMMVDVDPDLRVANGFSGEAQAVLRRRIEGDSDVEVLRFGRRLDQPRTARAGHAPQDRGGEDPPGVAQAERPGKGGWGGGVRQGAATV